MQIFRNPFSAMPQSPNFELYGERGGILIAAFDLILMELQGGSSIFKPSSVLGLFNGAAVSTPAGGNVGVIADYDWPPVNAFDIKPYVKITPSIGTDLSKIPKISIAAPPTIASGDPVTLKIGNGIPGNIVQNTIFIRAYPDFSSQVKCYRIDFDQHLLSQTHGGRIVHNASNVELGMLISTQNQSNGTCHAIVFPSHLIN